MLLVKSVLLILCFLSPFLFSDDLGYRYKNGKCLDAGGKEGLNPNYIGECGNLAGKIMDSADLQGKNLKGADFSKASLKKANLSGAMLTGSKLNDALLNEAVFTGANLSGAFFKKADLTKASFVNCIADNVTFQGAKLVEAGFPATQLSFSNFSLSDVSGANFTKAVLTESNFDRAVMAKTIFKEANLENGNLSSAKAKESSFEGANLAEATMDGIEAEKASFKGAVLRGSKMVRGSFMKVNFRSARMEQADLELADLTAADLKGAILSEAKMKGTFLEGAKFSKSTMLPFTQEEALALGMTLIKNSKITLFYNTANLYDGDSGQGYSRSIRENIRYKEDFAVTQATTGAELSTILDESGVFIWPIFNGQKVFDATAQVVIKKYLMNGGNVVFNCADSDDLKNNINETLGLALTSTQVTENYTLNGVDAVGTTFSGGMNNLMVPSENYVLGNLPSGTKQIYKNGGNAGVVIIPIGKGNATYLSWCFLQAKPVGNQDGGWIEILKRSVDEARLQKRR